MEWGRTLLVFCELMYFWWWLWVCCSIVNHLTQPLGMLNGTAMSACLGCGPVLTARLRVSVKTQALPHIPDLELRVDNRLKL